MSMMDALNPQQQQPQQPQQPQPEARMRMGEQDMGGLFQRVMAVISSEIWEGSGADKVADQLSQPGAQPEEVVGKFTGYFLMMACSAANTKGGMLPPVVVAGAAGQVSSQLTDIALVMKIIEPREADDVADAGALIGMEVLLQNMAQSMDQDERQEYIDIVTTLVEASPEAQQAAAESSDQAVADVAEMSAGGEDTGQSNSGMTAALGGA